MAHLQPTRKLDMDKIKKKKSIIVSSEIALADVEPIQWSDDVLSGKKKVLIDSDYRK